MLVLSRDGEERALNLHGEAFVYDGHSDTPCDVVKRRVLGEKSVLEKHYVEGWRRGGLDGLLMSTTAPLLHYPTHHGDWLEGGLKFFDSVLQESEECSDSICIATTVEDMLKAERDGRVAMVLGFEGGEPIEGSLGNLRMFHRMGLRVLQLTWNYRNLICDGVSEPSNSGLSNFGFELIEEMNRLRIVIDVSHASRNAFRDVMEASKAPVIVSHACCRALYDHPRNLSDEELKIVGEKDGVVGIAFYPRFVSRERPKLEDVLNHIEHAADVMGIDHVGLGPDFIDYCLDRMVDEIRQVRLPHYSEDIHLYPVGLEDASKLPNITRGLVARGYSDEEVKKVLGGSFLRVYKQVWGR